MITLEPFEEVSAPATTNGAYSAGDIVGGLMTFTVNGPVEINSVLVAIKAAVVPALKLIIFNDNPTGTTTTDNAAYSLAAADVLKVRGTLDLNAMGAVFVDHGTPNTWQLGNLFLDVEPKNGTNLYALLIDGTGVTLTSVADVQVVIAGRGA